MARLKKAAKVANYLSLQTAVRHLCDDCQTEEDAAALITEGAVKVNDKLITDAFHAMSPGIFNITIGNETYKAGSASSNMHNSNILAFVNSKENLKRLRDGEGLSLQIATDGRKGTYHLMFEPPLFNGDTIIACYFGETVQKGLPSRLGSEEAAHGLSECGLRK